MDCGPIGHMHRFFISPENWDPGALTLAGSEAHHARDVLRMRMGEKLVLFNGRGREITAEIVDLGGDEIRLRKLHEAETPPFQCRISLGQAIPKGKNMDLIVQKAVEIGAAEIAPIISERTIVDLDAKEAAQKQLKWQQIAIEAAKQCGQNWLPRVRTPRKLKNFFSSDWERRLPSRRTKPDRAAVKDSSLVTHFARRSHSEAGHSLAAPKSFEGGSLSELRLIGSLQPDAQHLKTILTNYSKEHC